MTQTSAPNDSLNGWLITPAGTLVSFIAKEMIISAVTHRALIAAQYLPLLFRIAKGYVPLDNDSFHGPIQNLINMSSSDQHFAKEEADNGYNTIFSHHAITLWAALETTIETTLKNLVRRVENSEDLIRKNAPTIAPKPIRTTTDREALRTIRTVWEPALQSYPDVIDRAVHMLSAFGLIIRLNTEPKRRLSELAEMRNIILHKAGIVDQRFKDKCPWRRDSVGESIRIDYDAMGTYFDAAIIFSKELLGQVSRSKYIRLAPAD